MNAFTKIIYPEVNDSDLILEQLMSECDDTLMPLPDIESEPRRLISKVRKHYMDYIVKLLTVNYENNQKLLNKNVYLPSAIWRCAKIIEMNAAQTCMVPQIYRQNVVPVIKELKNDTKKGKLNKMLYDCLRKPPENEKKQQTSFTDYKQCNCQCQCNKRKKRRKSSDSLTISQNNMNEPITVLDEPERSKQGIGNQKVDLESFGQKLPQENLIMANGANVSLLEKSTRMSIESQDSDELMMQLEKIFQGDSQEDDLFDGALCDTFDPVLHDDGTKKIRNNETQSLDKHNLVIENHAAQIKSLDERLASLTGLLVNPNDNLVSQEKVENPKNNKRHSSKWLCEEYFLKSRLYELLDEIGEKNRKKLARIKKMLIDLFGDDSDDEGVMSPLDETPEFVISCKERIAPWVVKLLTPFYIKGRIRGKALFKALAKHLIKLIYQCSRYPHEYEVESFISDFLESHKMIRCEADFKQFRIENL